MPKTKTSEGTENVQVAVEPIKEETA